MRIILKTGYIAHCLAASFIAGMAGTSFAQDGHVITMQEVDIRSFIDDVAIVTGRTFLVDPRVQGKVTISSEKSLTPTQVFDVFKDVMRVHGYTVVRTASGQYRVTLMQGAAQDAPYVSQIGANGQFATTIIKLSYVDASDAAKLIKPVMHSQGVLTANPGGDILVITDFPENLRKAREIVKAMDNNGLIFETINLANISAMDAEAALKAVAGPRPTYRSVAVPGSNSLLIEGEPQEISRVKAMLQKLDENGIVKAGPVSVIPLRYADGEKLLQLLTSILPAYVQDGKPVPTVAHETGSNTIVISASSEVQKELEQIIRRLDIRRPQVLVEAVIVEISDTAARELGVQFALGGIDGTTLPFIGTNFSRQAPNVLALAGALAGGDLGLDESQISALETAAVESIFGSTGAIGGGVSIDDDALFAFVINAIEEDKDSNVLSTPFVTTLDNVPARFVVGQEIPITTGESLGTDNANPFRTFDREEVGIKLDILPQISEGDVIRLEIKQEVSSIAGALSAVSSDFVTNTREIETTVLASDGEIIVLGGLIQDDEQITVEKVPVLGDAPIVGGLFRSKGKSRSRTNLMVFLRPTIIRNQADADPLTQSRLNQMRRADLDQSGRSLSKIDQFFLNEQPVNSAPR